MKKLASAFLPLMLLASLASPAAAAPCSRLPAISSGEAGFIYCEAEADLGAGTANRLWAACHRLRYRCAGRPWSRVVVDVEPRVKAFLEAHR